MNIFEKMGDPDFIERMKAISSERKAKGLFNGYNCPKCKDSGWIFPDMWNQSFTAVPCDCAEARYQATADKKAGVTLDKNFRNFKLDTDLAKSMYSKAKVYIERFDKNNKSLLILGQSGSGKTHLMTAIMDELRSSHKRLKQQYFSYIDLILLMREYAKINQVMYRKTLDDFKKLDLLLIDDLFKGGLENDDLRIIFDVINTLYMEKVKLIVTSEFLIDDIRELDEAIAGRLYEMAGENKILIGKDAGRNRRFSSK